MGNGLGISGAFDPVKHSYRVSIDSSTRLYLSAQTTSIVAILTTYTFDSSSTVQFRAKLTLDYGPHALPVIGIFYSEPDVNELWLEDDDNPDFSFWHLSSGKLVVRGQEQSLLLPKCKPGALIEISVTSSNIKLTVTNLGSFAEEKTFTLPDLSVQSLPFVGAVRTGRDRVKFELIDGNGHEQPGNALVDITTTTKFDSYEGVVRISSDGKSLLRTTVQQGNGYALINQIIRKGIHRFVLCITCDFGASLCIGVARYPFKLSSEYIKDVMKHVYRHPGLILWRSYRGLLYRDGKQQDNSTEALGWQHGNSVYIELVINMDERTIEILKNDQSLGIIFSDIPEVVQPVVCFYAAYEKAVELVSYKVSQSAITPPKPKPRTSLQYHSPISIPTKAEFDPQTKSGYMSVSYDKMTVFREKNQSGNSLCLLNITCQKNCHYRLSFVVENDQGASICIGVTDIMNSRDIRISGVGNIYSSPNLYVFRSFQGMLYSKGRELPKHLEEFWMTGTLIEMIVDVDEDEATVKYTINGNDQGIAFSRLQPPLRPLVAFYAGMEKRVTLIHFEAKAKRIVPQLVTADTANRFTRLRSIEPTSKLPIVMGNSHPAKNMCIVCGKPVDCIALPCKHEYMCAEHLSKQGRCHCGASDFTMWNIL